MREINFDFLQLEVVLFLDLGLLQVSDSNELGICLLCAKIISKNQGPDKDKSYPLSTGEGGQNCWKRKKTQTLNNILLSNHSKLSIVFK